MTNKKKPKHTFKEIVGHVIFRHDTPASKAFDIVLLILIVFSIILVMLESVASINERYHSLLWATEWIITILFTIEYLLRIYSAKKPWVYVKSFYGIVDLISIIPTYLTLFAVSSHYLTTIRALRLLRVFRIFKLNMFIGESTHLYNALRASRYKITVFLTTVLMCAIIIGSIMYVIEGDEAGFTSIPRSIYWAIVTLTTVGYGDIAPQTFLGQTLAAVVMILGYGIIAVPTGIVTAELANAENKVPEVEKLECPTCDKFGLDPDSKFCKHCGSSLED